LCNKLLSSLQEEGSMSIKSLLVGVRGVAITSDLWMSRKTDDNLSLDMHFISADWKVQHKYIGVISCKDGFKGGDIDQVLNRALQKYDLLNRAIYVVIDGSGNLATTTRVLASQGMTHCVLRAKSLRYLTLCFAQNVNGACNVAVLVAKSLSTEVHNT
jgi:hypothetical protein